MTVRLNRTLSRAMTSCRTVQRQTVAWASVLSPSGSDRVERPAGEWLEVEQRLPELDRLRVVDVDRAHDRLELGLDLVHQLHRLEDAERLALGDDVADLDEGGRARLRRAVERADHRRLDPNDAVRGTGRL